MGGRGITLLDLNFVAFLVYYSKFICLTTFYYRLFMKTYLFAISFFTIFVIFAGCGKPKAEDCGGGSCAIPGAVQDADAKSTASNDVSSDTISGALEWLASQQKEDGSFSNPDFPAMTAFAMQAMYMSGNTKYAPNVDKAVEFILSRVQSDGGIYKKNPNRKGGGLSNYNTAICMTALSKLQRKELTTTLLNARTFMAKAQELNDNVFKGGFGYDSDSDRAYADLSNTSYALEAMRATQSLEDERGEDGQKADLNWEAALKFVEGLQNDPDSGENNAGGFFYTYNDPKAGTETNTVQTATGTEERIVFRSYGSVTYQGLMSMIYCQLPKHDPRVISALSWAGKHWTLDENPGSGQQGVYFFYNVVSRALVAAQVAEINTATAGTVNWRDAMSRKFLSLQQEDFSWINENARFMENDPVLVTSYVLIALYTAQ